MVERGDEAPLLRWAEGPAVSPPLAPDPQAGGRGWGGGRGGRAAVEPPRRREPEELGPSQVLLQPGRLELGDVEEDQVVAVFVVTFDPRSGESRSETAGGERVAPHWASGAAGEGLAARAPAHVQLPPRRPGCPGRVRCPREVGAWGFVPCASDPVFIASRCLSADPQPARPSPQSCLRFSGDRGSCLWPQARWLLFSFRARLKGTSREEEERPPGEFLPKRIVLSFHVPCFPPLLPIPPCTVTL